MIITLKSKETWSKEEDNLANSNFKALNVIFVVNDVTQFKLIVDCESIRDEWIILQNVHEGTLLFKI